MNIWNLRLKTSHSLFKPYLKQLCTHQERRILTSFLQSDREIIAGIIYHLDCFPGTMKLKGKSQSNKYLKF